MYNFFQYQPINIYILFIDWYNKSIKTLSFYVLLYMKIESIIEIGYIFIFYKERSLMTP